jgi:hypothetical protein
MPIISSSDIVADNEADLLAQMRESASALFFHPRGAVRCRGVPLFRSQAARDLGCLLDVDPVVESWTCLPMVLAYGTGMHVSDFAVDRSDGTVLTDAVPPDAKSPPPDWVPDVARDLGYRYEAFTGWSLPKARPTRGRDQVSGPAPGSGTRLACDRSGAPPDATN